ncbi:MAG: endonuclease NucS domain-containing protein [Planctomycetota bacterium]
MPLRQVKAGDFEYVGNGIFELKDNHNIRIDARRSGKEIKGSLKSQECFTKNIGGFQFQLRNREGYPGPLKNISGRENHVGENQGTLLPAPTLELEQQLRDWLAHEIEQGNIEINGVKIKLYKSRNGVEYPAGDAGKIDILTTDEQGNFIVFELKLSRGTVNALGQIQGYMGWVKQNLAQNKEVRGVIIAQEIDNNLRYAVSVNPNITLLKYKLHFTLEKVS